MTRYLYLFDFDDTLYPTTHMRNPEKFSKPINQNTLEKLDYTVTKLFHTLLNKEFNKSPPIDSEFGGNVEFRNEDIWDTLPLRGIHVERVVPFNPSPSEEDPSFEDDTLSETSSEMSSLSARLFDMYKPIKTEDLIKKSPKIIIISNASYLALRHNMWDLERFDNMWYPRRDKEVEIISSRDEMTEKYAELKKTGTKLKIHEDIGLKKYTEEATPQEITRFHRNLWKISTSINILEGFVGNLLKDLEEKRDKIKIISFGDDESERMALKHLQIRFKDNPNFSAINVNFKPELSDGDLALNLETVFQNLETIKNSDKDIEVDGEEIKF